jgi:putative salt-induced outer membrane protein
MDTLAGWNLTTKCTKEKIMRNLFILLAIICFSSSLAAAEEAGWSGKGEFGLVLTSGNSDTQSVNLALGFEKNSEKWKHTFAAGALNAESDDLKTANRFDLNWQSNYNLNETSYVLGSLRYVDDDFSAFSETIAAVLGYGRKIIDGETHKLNGEIGIGYREDTDALTRRSNSEAIVSGVVDYSWTISETTAFTNKFLIESGSDNTFVENDTALSVSINDKLALKLGLNIRHNTDVTGLVDDTDTVTTANLVYNFK